MKAITPKEALDLIKLNLPRLRRKSPVALIHSGGSQTRYNCVFCGEGHAAATRHRGETRHEKQFFAHHNAGRCLEDEDLLGRIIELKEMMS